MGKIVTITATGEVPLPQDVRDALGLMADGVVEVEMLGDDAAVIRKPRANGDGAERERLIQEIKAVSEQFAFLREGRPTDEIMRDIRGDDPFLR